MSRVTPILEEIFDSKGGYAELWKNLSNILLDKADE